MIRLGDKCQFCSETLPAGAEPLLQINERNSDFHVDEFAIHPAVDPLWLVVKDLPDKKGCRLSEGDVFKIGRLIYTVKQLSLDGKAPLALPSATTATEVEVYQSDGVQLLACRICLGDTQTLKNPLISPCKCAGTMKFIHIECLQEWLKNRLNVKQNGSALSYFWQTFDCELCKADFPTTVKVGGLVRELVEVHKPDTPFLVLEESKREGSGGLHVVSLTEAGCFRIGRGHNCDIRVSDISVSRIHAMLKLYQGKFYLEDRNSKFGTLVLVRQPIALVPGLSVSLQITRSVITLRLKQPWTLFRCCSCFPHSTRVSNFPISPVPASLKPDFPCEEDACPPREVVENTEQVREVTEVREFHLRAESSEDCRPLGSANP